MTTKKTILLVPLLLFHACFVDAYTAHEVGSVTFWESRPGTFLRSASSNDSKGYTFSNVDVSAAMAVLLGSAPSLSFTGDGASKLNELLAPTPFHRPSTVLMLTIQGFKPVCTETKLRIEPGQHRGLAESATATLTLPDDVGPTFLSVNLDEEFELADVDQMLHDLAGFLDASYEADEELPKGRLVVSLPDGDNVVLDLSKEDDWALALEIAAVMKTTTKAVADSEAGDLVSPKRLFVGTITSGEHKLGFLNHVVAKLLNYVDLAHNGAVVGVVASAPDLFPHLRFSSRQSRLQLLESSSDTITTAAAELLTETIIAYITGILFVVALIIGTCFLVKMPLTRDTLLYSGVKLD